MAGVNTQNRAELVNETSVKEPRRVLTRKRTTEAAIARAMERRDRPAHGARVSRALQLGHNLHTVLTIPGDPAACSLHEHSPVSQCSCGGGPVADVAGRAQSRCRCGRGEGQANHGSVLDHLHTARVRICNQPLELGLGEYVWTRRHEPCEETQSHRHGGGCPGRAYTTARPVLFFPRSSKWSDGKVHLRTNVFALWLHASCA
jgi:hypothetical protein